jgi:hypothetical protein
MILPGLKTAKTCPVRVPLRTQFGVFQYRLSFSLENCRLSAVTLQLIIAALEAVSLWRCGGVWEVNEPGGVKLGLVVFSCNIQ